MPDSPDDIIACDKCGAMDERRGYTPLEYAPEADGQWPTEMLCRLCAAAGVDGDTSWYYIQNKGYCGDCLLWWKDGGHGYTVNLKNAWMVPEEQAIRICANRPDEDFRWPVIFIDAIAERHVNSETLNAIRRLAQLPENKLG